MKFDIKKSSRLFPLILGCVLGTAFSVRAADAPDKKGQFSAADYKFASAAAQGGMMEVDLGNLATQKANNPAVKHFGEQMVEDHGKAGDKLKEIATSNGATLPDKSSGEQKEMDFLNKLSGAEFDKAYMALMVRDHRADLKEFEHAAQTVENADLKAFASDTSAVVRNHLNMAETIQKQVKTEVSSAK